MVTIDLAFLRDIRSYDLYITKYPIIVMNEFTPAIKPIAAFQSRPTSHLMANGFDKRQDEDGLWEVYDGDNDRVVTIDGLPLSGLDEVDADEAIRQLSRGEVSPDTSPESP